MVEFFKAFVWGAGFIIGGSLAVLLVMVSVFLVEDLREHREEKK